ncbi:MAG: hypothetical protein PF448_12550 [Bacteroidales bacterium]|jgi:hypothetical protein|nr:hypothetical protein [Bacteroidales bacterium]
MKSISIYVIIIIAAILTSCNQKQLEIKTNYSDLPETEAQKFEEVLEAKGKSLTTNSVDIMKDYTKKYLLASSNPTSSGIVTNYFWYVYNALPEFVDESERHQGYYVGDNDQSEEERLIAYAIYKIDRSPENLTKVFEMIKPELKDIVSENLYHSLGVNQEFEKRIRSYDILVEIDNYKELLTKAYMHADTATGILYDYGDTLVFETFNNAYGMDVYSLTEIICQHLAIDRYDPLYGNNSLSFWMRRNHEGNMETVYDILNEIKTIYANQDTEEPEKTTDETKTYKNVKSFTGMFNMLVPGTDGTWFLFHDKEGNEYDFFDNGDCQKARDLFYSVQPMNSDHQYQSTEFHVEYITKEVEFLNKAEGGTIMREIDVITKIEEL